MKGKNYRWLIFGFDVAIVISAMASVAIIVIVILSFIRK